MNSKVIVLDHPLIQHKLSLLREKSTPTATFRQLIKEISILLGYEVTRDLPLSVLEVQTPLERATTHRIEGKKVVLVPILRAGLGILEGMLEILPSARVGHIGIYREPSTLQSVQYYQKIPQDAKDRDIILIDPMLATGNSAVAAVGRLKELQPRSIKFVCILAAPEGISKLHENHPDIPVYTAAIDRCLNDHGYILPGLGDAGDRIFGTK